jgi:SAM-dependent MidA family methyltransferase
MPTTKHTKLVLDAFAKRLEKRSVMPFDEYVEFALYDGQTGYYATPKTRVGKSDQSDFLTSSSFGGIWGELIVDACRYILEGENLSQFTFVEIAAEPEQFVLSEIDHPFGETQIIRLGDPHDIPSPAIVYSNEWLDAQAFKRFCFNPEERKWQEIGVMLENGSLRETPINSPLSLQALGFPHEYTQPYQVDWPSGSIEALERLCGEKWSGLFLTFDYGLGKEILLKERPLGTARSYHRHKMGSDLLSKVGEQDITCHLCWDELVGVLENSEFNRPQLVSQESFLMNHASGKIKEILSGTTGDPTSKTQVLKELMHPFHMGNKFQALWALRGNERVRLNK